MKAWNAFSAIDMNNDNYLSIKELKMLLWIYDEEEPNEFRLVSEMREIDEDKSNSIDKFEWIEYLCCINKDGERIFRPKIKRIFEKFCQSGVIQFKCLIQVIRELFFEKIKIKVTESKLKKFNSFEIIESFIEDIYNELDFDLNKNLTWKEFKLFIDRSADSKKILNKFI